MGKVPKAPKCCFVPVFITLLKMVSPSDKASIIICSHKRTNWLQQVKSDTGVSTR